MWIAIFVKRSHHTPIPCAHVFYVVQFGIKIFNYCPKLIIQQCYKRITLNQTNAKESWQVYSSSIFPFCLFQPSLGPLNSELFSSTLSKAFHRHKHFILRFFFFIFVRQFYNLIYLLSLSWAHTLLSVLWMLNNWVCFFARLKCLYNLRENEYSLNDNFALALVFVCIVCVTHMET